MSQEEAGEQARRPPGQHGPLTGRRRRVSQLQPDGSMAYVSECLVPACGRLVSVPNRRSPFVCQVHRSAVSFQCESRGCRFCQRCYRIHWLQEFDGLQSSCRHSLHRLRMKRKKKQQAEAEEKSAGEAQGAGGSANATSRSSGRERSQEPGSNGLLRGQLAARSPPGRNDGQGSTGNGHNLAMSLLEDSSRQPGRHRDSRLHWEGAPAGDWRAADRERYAEAGEAGVSGTTTQRATRAVHGRHESLPSSHRARSARAGYLDEASDLYEQPRRSLVPLRDEPSSRSPEDGHEEQLQRLRSRFESLREDPYYRPRSYPRIGGHEYGDLGSPLPRQTVSPDPAQAYYNLHFQGHPQFVAPSRHYSGLGHVDSLEADFYTRDHRRSTVVPHPLRSHVPWPSRYYGHHHQGAYPAHQPIEPPEGADQLSRDASLLAEHGQGGEHASLLAERAARMSRAESQELQHWSTRHRDEWPPWGRR